MVLDTLHQLLVNFSPEAIAIGKDFIGGGLVHLTIVINRAAVGQRFRLISSSLL